MTFRKRRDDRGENLWKKFTADMISYAGTDYRPWSVPFLKNLFRAGYGDLGILAVVVYRYGQWVAFACQVPVLRQICQIHYQYLFWWIRTRLQIEIPYKANIGPGFRIYHFGHILIHRDAVAGKGLRLSMGVMIGSKDGVPHLGDDVYLASGAKLFGAITIGDRAVISAGSVVSRSFPDDAIVAGNPARQIGSKESFRQGDSSEIKVPPTTITPLAAP